MIENLDVTILEIESLRNSNNLGEAIHLMQQLLDQQPDWEHGEGWYDLSLMLTAVGKNHEAIGCVERALGYQPGQPVFRIQLVDLLSKYGDADVAFQTFLEVVRLNPTIYSNPSYSGPRNEALRLMSQILTRRLMSASEAKSRCCFYAPNQYNR